MATILFDLDGTLLDTIPLIVECFQDALQAHAIAAPPSGAIIEGIGRRLRPQMADFCPESELDAVIETYSTMYRNRTQKMRVFDGVLELLEDLSRSAVQMAIVTSKSRAGTDRVLASTPLGPFFEVSVSADEVRDAKPHPEPVHRALALLEAPAETALFVGDSAHDLAAGRAAGVRTVAVSWSAFDRSVLEAEAPDAFIDHPRALLDLIHQP